MTIQSRHQPPSQKPLVRWLADRELRGNPFESWNAEHEHDLPNYFIDLGGFDELLRQTEPCIVFAQRGCGKTAQRQMLAAQCRPLNRGCPWLAITYTYSGFERALRAADDDLRQLRAIHHVRAILALAVQELVAESSCDAAVRAALEHPDVTGRLAAYTARFAPHLADAPAVEGSGFLDDFSSPELLQGFSELAATAGLERCVVLVDGLDEFSLTAGDPSKSAQFLAPLLGTLPLIECPGWAFKFYLPLELKPVLSKSAWFRPDRFRHISHIAWKESSLLALFRERLTHFSQREPPHEDLAQLCQEALAQIINQELLALSNLLPRAALMLANELLERHSRQPHPPDFIALETWQQVKDEWQTRRADLIGQAQSGERPATGAEPSPHPPEQTGGMPMLHLDEQKGLVWLGTLEIRSKIKPKDYSVLACLHRHKGEICNRDQIAVEAWPDIVSSAGVSDEAIAASIARLRRVLRELVPNRGYIETFRSKKRDEGGYRLIPEGFDQVVE